MALEIGTLLNDRYRIERVLGQGGFGAVYQALDRDLGIPCAVKENLNASPQAERQFRREATLLAGLRHPNLPRVTNHFILAGHQYLVMDFVEGDDLRQRLEAAGALPPSDALRWVLQLCEALTYLHTQKPAVIHRDIKPANIKITPEGEAVLVDFGIAKLVEAGQKTTTGAAALTSGYAPPEQYQMGSTDGRTDEYALAATLYHLLTGRIPPDSVERLIGQAALTPVEELRPDVPANVAAALHQALEIRPDARFPDVAGFAAALRDADFRYAPAPAAGAPLTGSALAAETAPAATQAAEAPPTQARPRTWRAALAAAALAVWVLFAALLLTAGLVWLFVGPGRLNDQILTWLGRPTNPPPRLVAAVPPATLFAPLGSPYPTSSPYRSPTLSPTPTFTPPPSHTPTPTLSPTPTFTPAPRPASAENAGAWRPFGGWAVGDPAVLAALSPDGRLAAVFQPEGVQGVEIVDAVTGASQAQLSGFIIRDAPLGLGLTDESVLVLFADEVWVRGLGEAAAATRLNFFKAPARELRLSPDRQWVAVRAADYLTLYHLASKTLRNLGDKGASQAYAFAPDSRYVALAVGTDVELYALPSGRLERRLLGRNKAIRGLAFTADGARLVATSGDVWDVATARRLATFDSAADLEQVAVSPNGAVIVGSDGEVWGLAAEAGGGLPRLGRVSGLPAGLGRGQLAFLQDGALLWAQVPGQPPALFAVDPNTPRRADAATPTAVATPDRELIGSLNVSRLSELASLQAGAAGFALSPSGARALTWTGSSLAVVAVADQRPILNQQIGRLVDAAFLGEDFLLLLLQRGGGQYWVERWEIATQQKRQDYGPFDEKARRLAANAPAGLFAVQGKYIEVLDVTSGDLKYNLGSADTFQPFAFTPDGRYLAIAARAAVGLWDMSTGRQAAGQFGGHGPDVTGLAFTPDGRLLAGASGDVWDVESRRRVAAFDPVPAVGLSPDGTLAVGADGTLWDAGTGQYLGRLAGRGQALAFAPDGRSLIWQAVNDEVLLLGIRPVAAHQRLGGGAAAPDLLPLEPANVVSATLLGWWGADPLLNLRLIQDAPQSQAAVLGRNPFEALTLSPDGRTVTALTAAGLDQINPASGAAVDRFAIFLNPETVTTAAYLGADLLLLKGRAGVERWDLAAQSLLQRYNLQGEGLVVSPDGRWFALRQAGNVLVVDAAAGAVKHTFRVQAGPQEYQFAPDGRTLAVATGVLVDLYDVETGQRAASLRGRAGRPFGLAFAPDGTRLYAASGDVWSLPDGAPVFEQRLDLAAARLAVSPDGRLLAGDDGSLWDTATGLRVATLPELRGPAAELLFTADGRQLPWRLADGRVYTWGVRPPAPPAARAFGARAVTVDNARLLAITDHLGRGRLLDAVWSADDGYLAVNTTANVVIYTADTLARQRAFLDAAVLAFDAQGRALVGGLNHPLQLVDVGTGAVVKDYQRTGILAAAFSPDGRQLALGGRLTPDGKFLDGVAVIDPDGLERTFSPGLGSYDRFTGFAFTPDGTTLVVSFPGVNVRGSIWLWDVANGSRVREPIRGNSLPAVISPDSKYLAYLSGTRIVIENLRTGGGPLYLNADGAPFLEQSIDIPTKFPISYAYLRNGQLLVFYRETSRRGGGVSSSAYVWTITPTSIQGAQRRHGTLLTLSALTGRYAAEYARDRQARTPTFGLGPAETRFFTLTGDGRVRVWDYNAGRELARSETDTLPLLALSPDGRTVAVPDAGGAIELRAVDDGALVKSIAGEWAPDGLAYSSASLLLVWQAGQVFVVNTDSGAVVEQYAGELYSRPEFAAVSPDGGLFAQWGRPGGRTVLNVFSLAPDRALFSLGVFPRPDQLRFSPDGRLLAVARGRAVELWDLETRRLAATLAAQGRAVGALAFSPDGARLYAATGEIWEVATGAPRPAFGSQAAAVVLSPNGQLLVGAEGTVWNAADGLLTGELAGRRGPAVNLVFTPDGERLIWQGGDGTIEVWSLP